MLMFFFSLSRLSEFQTNTILRKVLGVLEIVLSTILRYFKEYLQRNVTRKLLEL